MTLSGAKRLELMGEEVGGKMNSRLSKRREKQDVLGWQRKRGVET
jgi:hypothetical protein